MDLTNKQLQKLNDGREYRSMMLEIRAADEDLGGMVVEGYATTFNEPYVLYQRDNYTVLERVAADAFVGCDMADVILQYNHEGRVFARTKNGTLQLTPDDHGLKVIADLSGTELGRQLYQEIKGGYTDQMSFGFVVAKSSVLETTDQDTGNITITRTIEKVKKLYDVSAVSIPANDMTSITARGFADGVIQQIEAERLEWANRVRKIKLLMEVC